MWWTKDKQSKQAGTGSQAPVLPRPPMVSSPLMRALEPRIMFDAAMAVTAHEAVAAEQQAADAGAHEATPAAPAASTGRSVVFVDARVVDAQQLLQGANPNAEVVMLKAGEDGIAQMAAYLARGAAADNIQVLAHGNQGDLWLGSTYLSSSTLASHASELAQLGAGIRTGGDILLYACNTAGGEVGQAFVQSLATLTGRDVAASDDRTGSRGDWTLEISTGAIEASSALSASSMAAYAHDLATITVTSNGDTGAGTLRNAISGAQAGDTITFQSSMTVQLSSGQLFLNKNLIIDGDLDNNGTADVTIDANHNSRVFAMITGNVTLDGLVITKGLVSGNGGAYNSLAGALRIAS